jgi:pilus assembly protein CpaB
VVPEGLQEVTVSLPAPRILGGNVVAGDTVGVVASLVVKTEDGKDIPSTTFILHKVLVTSIQFSNADATAIEQSIGVTQNSVNRYPAESVLVTLAVSATDAARIVYTAEFGTMWLTLEGPSAAVGDEGVFDITDFISVIVP